jgi:hypothetical protein
MGHISPAGTIQQIPDLVTYVIPFSSRRGLLSRAVSLSWLSLLRSIWCTRAHPATAKLLHDAIVRDDLAEHSAPARPWCPSVAAQLTSAFAYSALASFGVSISGVHDANSNTMRIRAL